MKRRLFAAASLLLMLNATAQTPWLQEGNSSTNPTLDFVGTDDNEELVFRTDGLFRFRLNRTETYGTLGGFTNVPANGFALISPNDNFLNNAPGPFSLLHLAEGDAPNQAPYRHWFSTGITFTKGNLIGYVGPEQEVSDQDNMVLHWGGTKTKNRMRFVFTEGYDQQSATGTSSLEGMEFMRLYPSSNTEPFVGIGDWFAANFNDPTITEPEERLDIVDGRVRIRELPTGSPANTLNKYMVVDDDGVVHYRDLPAGTGCEWNLLGNNPVTAYDGNPCPPQSVHRVGIGTSAPSAKLHVVKNMSNGLAEERGAFIQNSLSNVTNYGLDAWATGAESGWNYGVRGLARNAGRTYGVYGRAFSGAGVHAHGTYGLATGSTINEGVVGEAHDGVENYGGSFAALGQSNSLLNYGVNASATGPMTAVNYAGYFAGDVYTTGMYLPSDEALKTNVNEVDALDHDDPLTQLRLYTYQYDQGAAPGMNLPQGDQLGLMASELEELFPGLVKRSIQPAVLDTLGAEVHPQVEFTAVNYQGLIPYLIMVQQQQAHRLATLEQALAACCAPTHDGAFMQAPLDSEGKSKMDPAMERLLRIDPNPFTEVTTVRYTLERAGRLQLLVNGGDGKRLQVLHEGLASAGDHSYDWNTGHLAPGVYYVTLLLDGEPLVKRAVKVR